MTPSPALQHIAYFTMEIAVDGAIPTYAGGLGVLAGDTVRAAGDVGLPFVCVTLLHRGGYFRQRLDDAGSQTEDLVSWNVERFLDELPTRAEVQIEGRVVVLRPWRYTTASGVAVYFLDADLDPNDPRDRALTGRLYGGDERYRLAQEIILGIGGARMLDALGIEVAVYHMNEGHSSLLAVELLEREARRTQSPLDDARNVDAVRRRCVFTTHTPVFAGHDQFAPDVVRALLGERWQPIVELMCHQGRLNMTFAGLNLSHYVNGVAKRHGVVSSHLFAGKVIDAITNGVHAVTWAGPAFQDLFDRTIPGWREDNFSLRNALSLPDHLIWDAHATQKRALLERVNAEADGHMNEHDLTLGFARRMTPYKRPHLLFSDLQALRNFAERWGPLQIVYAGMAHPRDDEGKDLIRRIFAAARELGDAVRFVFLENYDLATAALLTQGVDVWLNTPLPPNEASGTSGMKAALNGIPSLSVMDGWWLEGCIEGVTGWAIGADAYGERASDEDLASIQLMTKLRDVVAPLYYERHASFTDVMRHAIALNGSFFNAQRMLQQYAARAYL